MKEIIYLDTDLMNSMLAQLDEGIVNSFSFEEAKQESETAGQQSNRGKNAGLRGSINVDTGFLPGGGLRLDTTLGNNGMESTNESRTLLEGQKDVLNKAFHDHALEVLTQKLINNEQLSDGNHLKEGDLYLGEDRYRFYDFNLLKKAMDQNFMKELLFSEVERSGMSLAEAKKLLAKSKPTAQEREKMEIATMVIEANSQFMPIIDIFNKLNLMSNFASNLLEELSIIKTNNKIGLLKKRYLRESAESLSFRTDNSRKAKYLVRVIGKKEKVYSDFNIPLLSENDLDVIPNMMVDLILGTFKIITIGDILVTPIAIYYE